MTDYEKLKAEIAAELKPVLMAELTAKKREESAWRKARGALREQLVDTFGARNSWKVIDATAVIGRMALERNIVTNFTDEDVKTVEAIMNDLVAVCVKYKAAQAR